MPRASRAAAGGICYHVLNRGNGGAVVYRDEADYQSFINLIDRTRARLPMRVLAYCLMPNHFHLVLWPHGDSELSRWMQLLTTAYVRRHHRRHDTAGHLWQARFKAFPIQEDAHLFTVLRYVERNPLRAGLVGRAEDWRWSSLPDRLARRGARVHPSPLPLPRNWRKRVNGAETAAELEAIRGCVNRGTPMGDPPWASRMAGELGLASTLRPHGRPRKQTRAGEPDPTDEKGA